MTPKLIEFNKENWTGEKGYLLMLDEAAGFFCLQGFDDDMAHWTMSIHGNDAVVTNETEAGYTVEGFEYDGFWTFYKDGIDRSDKNPYVAFAKLMWNF